MECKKISITNIGTFLISFSYQECSDTQWRYQVELEPGQKKEVFIIDGTLYIPQLFEEYALIDEEVFPPTPSNTRSNDVTPTPTPTVTITPTITPTPTVTPTPTEVPSVSILYRPYNEEIIPPVQGAFYSDSLDSKFWVGTNIDVYFDDEGFDVSTFEFFSYTSFWNDVITNIGLGVEYEISFKNNAPFQIPTPNPIPSLYQVNSVTDEGGYYKLQLTLLNGIEYQPSNVGGGSNGDEIKLYIYS